MIIKILLEDAQKMGLFETSLIIGLTVAYFSALFIQAEEVRKYYKTFPPSQTIYHAGLANLFIYFCFYCDSMKHPVLAVASFLCASGNETIALWASKIGPTKKTMTVVVSFGLVPIIVIMVAMISKMTVTGGHTEIQMLLATAVLVSLIGLAISTEIWEKKKVEGFANTCKIYKSHQAICIAILLFIWIPLFIGEPIDFLGSKSLMIIFLSVATAAISRRMLLTDLSQQINETQNPPITT